tara:strand:- start:737 stop:2161 length:1425 start_codon:yes stop_codon:yes gene_type:complete
MDAHKTELSSEQKFIIHKFKEGKNLFITGPGGTGKSFLIRHMIKEAKNKDKKVDVCALTGCAALLLNCGAKTIHSWAGIGLAKEENSLIATRIELNGKKRRNWRKVDVLIIDEVSMMSQKILELLDLIAKKVRKSVLPFGGIQIVFSGDFFQLPPVKSRTEDGTMNCFCFESPSWKDIFEPSCQIELTKIFRQKDNKYAKILNQIRKATISKNTCAALQERVHVKPDENAEITPTVLLPVKRMVEQINNSSLKAIEEESQEYGLERCDEDDFALSSSDKAKYMQTPKTILDGEMKLLMDNVNCDKKLELRKGAQVMCTVNIDLCGDNPICNGSLGIVKDFDVNNNPIVKFTNGCIKTIGKHIWKSENIPGIGVKQIPLTLAWAITIHKSQGATLDLAEIDVGTNIFEAGQTYVALSRVKSLDGLYLKSFDPTKIKVNRKVKKFYEELEKNEAYKQQLTTFIANGEINYKLNFYT